MKIIIFLILISILSNLSHAQLQQGPTPLQTSKIQLHNKKSSILELNNKKKLSPAEIQNRPYAEYENARYVFFSSDNAFKSELIKSTIAKNLPRDVTLVVYKMAGSDLDYWTNYYTQFIHSSRLKIIELDQAYFGFWSRDGLPVPVFNGKNDLNFVDAKYYHDFEPDQQMAKLFQIPLLPHNFYFEGGNFVANKLGDCLIVNNSRVVDIPDSIFSEKYGCKRTIRLPHLKGIGHADENVKFVNDNTVLSDTPLYDQILKDNGFDVVKLPRPQNSYETYANSLLVNGTVFVPIFNQSTDEEALNTYRNLGFKVVPLDSSYLSNFGKGSVHCITMSYPEMNFHNLVQMLQR